MRLNVYSQVNLRHNVGHELGHEVGQTERKYIEYVHCWLHKNKMCSETNNLNNTVDVY